MSKKEWIALVTVVFLLAIATAGCKTNPLADASLTFCDTVGNEYLAYVEADPKLDENAKKARRLNVSAFRMLAEEACK